MLKRIKVFPFLLFCSLMFSLQAKNDDAYDLVRSMGFMPIYRELKEAKDIELKSMDEKTHTLNEYRGHWLFLVFFATWCGPCAQEMPILESMHQKLQSLGLRILGLSVDQAPTMQVKKYVHQKGLTFPVLHDSVQQLAQNFQSSAVPTVFLISPDQKVVGVFRGANQWDTPKVMSSLEKLQAVKAVDENKVPDSIKKGEAKQEDVVYELTPPKIEMKILQEENESGYPQTLKVSLLWPKSESKGSSEYLIHVPELPSVEGLEVGNITSYSDTEQSFGTHFLFPLRFKEAKEYVLGPVELKYNHRYFGGGLQYARTEKIRFTPTHLKLYPWVLAGLGLILSVLGVRFFISRKKQKTKGALSVRENPVAANFLSEWDELRKLRMSGGESIRDYDYRLLKLACEVKKLQNEDCQKELIFLQELRYGGAQLALHERESLEKRVQNSLVIERET